MKEVKFLLICFLSSFYTSGWWLYLTINSNLLGIPVISTIILVILAAIYLNRNWNRDKKEKIFYP